MSVKLRDLATVLRSKNADPFITTCDVFIGDAEMYRAVKESGALTPRRVASAYGMPEEAVLGIFFIDNVQAVKVSFLKYVGGQFVASGDLEDDDVSGMQRHAPLAALEVPAERSAAGAPTDLVEVGPEAAIKEGDLRSLVHLGLSVVVTRVEGELYAFAETCTHRRCSLARGEIEGRHIVCPCHGAEFDVVTGEVRAGPATAPVATYRVVINGGTAFVEF